MGSVRRRCRLSRGILCFNAGVSSRQRSIRQDFVSHTAHFFTRLAREPGVLVTVDGTKGSVPREAGAWMAVFADAVAGTVGGGRLEFDAIAHARQMLPAAVLGAAAAQVRRYALGASLGQCCGGVVHLRFEAVSAADLPALRQRLLQHTRPMALFGGGHVGKALVRLLGTLPFDVHWVDSRDEIFPDQVPANAVCEHSDPVQDAVGDLPAGSYVLMMSFSHAEDLDVVAACLRRQRARAICLSLA
jgi:xanthine dehydrogenase accessory factor